MSLPFARDPATVPAHVLFPEAYAESKRMIVRDFLTYGVAIVSCVVALNLLY
jgi:hypothetical protein